MQTAATPGLEGEGQTLEGFAAETNRQKETIDG